MEKLNKNSKPYKTGKYNELFKASEMASMAMEDIVESGTLSWQRWKGNRNLNMQGRKVEKKVERKVEKKVERKGNLKWPEI